MKTLTITLNGGERRFALRSADLEALPSDAHVADVGTLVKGREGAAIRLSALLDHVAADADLPLVHVESRDGSFTANVTVEEARAAGLVLFRLGDDDLPKKFGGPFRLLFVDAADCSINVKDLARIDVVAQPGSHTASCALDEAPD